MATAGFPAVLVADSSKGDPQGSAQAETVPVFDMRHVERIRVRVWGNADLSGEYTLDHASSLSFPGLGRIEASTMTPADLERMLAQKLSARTRTDVTVSVNVERFRPFYIMGQVAEPGAIPWQPGLKVIQAITLARGVARSPDSPDSFIGQDRAIAFRQSRTRLTFALAQLARLKAEREGVDAGTANNRIKTLISRVPEEGSRAALTELVDRQNDILAEQRDVMQTQIIGLKREREAAQRELEAAQTQEKAVFKQLEMTRDLLNDIESLWQRKLVNRTRYLTHQTALLTAEVRYAEARSMVERARARLSGVDQQIVMIPQQRRLALNERIDEIEREVAHLELASKRGDPDNVLKLIYHITRETSSGVETIPATAFTAIFPGDVLIVSDGYDRVGTASLSPDSFVIDGRSGGTEDAAQRIIEGSVAPRRTVSTTATDLSIPY